MMKHQTLTVVIYCMILWATNWSISYDYDRTVGTTSSSFDLRIIGMFFAIISSYHLIKRIWKVVREYLENNITIPAKDKIIESKWYYTLLIPLIVGFNNSSHEELIDGTTVTKTVIYGTEKSLPLLIASLIFIILFNSLINLEKYNKNNT